MKTRLSAVVLVLAGILATCASAEEPKGKSAGSYVHVVIFKMKKDAPSGAVADAIADCHALLEKITAVRAVKAGRPATEGTPRLARKDYDFGLLVLVDDAAGLKGYLEDPLHLQFVEKHERHLKVPY
jgi:hypothetical protein